MRKENICKFVVSSSTRLLSTTNFYYESRVPHSGEMQLNTSHAVFLVSQGEGMFRTELVQTAVTPGTLLFALAGVPFYLNNVRELEYLSLTFSGERAQELLSRFGISPARCVFEGFGKLVPLWMDSLSRADSRNIDLLSESMLLYTFSKLQEGAGVSHTLRDDMLKLVEDGFTDPNFSLTVVADQLGYNTKYLSTLFKREMEIGFSDYLTNARMRHATFLMEQGVTAVKNVAQLSGFADPQYFSRVFKQRMGLSPRDYLARSE